MPDFREMDKNRLKAIRSEVLKRYEAFKAKHLVLDMTRGKPCPEQLDLSSGMLDCVKADTYRAADGTDCRNYGGVDGLPEAKALFAEYLEVQPDEIIIGGNSSLAMMHDALVRAALFGVPGGIPWANQGKVKFLCPSPGYDRHFFICDYLNIDMLPVEMDDDGPDMDRVEDLVKADSAIKGIWCVPKYSNPTGTTYSDQVVDRLAHMETRAKDFRIFWDNAYAVHHLTDTPDRLKNLLSACKKAGNPDRVFIYGSTSKISIAGSGLAFMAASKANIDQARRLMSYRTIGPDKINQLRHVRFFKDMSGIETHMKRHAAIAKPKFDAVDRILSGELNGTRIARWSNPRGGYFVSIDTLEGCAGTIVKMAEAAGVKLTPAGATYPYGKDLGDRNIRIAPTFPPLDQVTQAMELVAVCIQLACADRLLEGV